MIRFNITKGDSTVTTDWQDELIAAGPQATATVTISKLRQQYGPSARISVERNPVPERQPQEWVQFVLTMTDGTIRYSNAVLKLQADDLAGELAADYPKATISRREWKK